jgi:hypothetical protein
MTLPALLKGHDHISERESDGSWEDCTWDSGLEWYRLCYDDSKPATHAEAQALRAASGEPATGGSNLGDLRTGIARRYGKTMPAVISGFSALWAALTPGNAAVCQGGMSAFSSGHRLSRWQTNFDGSHAVFIARVDATDRVWWCDPLATDAGYAGEWITKAELASYVNAFGGQHLVSRLRTAEMPLYFANSTAKRLTIPAKTPILRTDGTVLKTTDAKVVKDSPMGVFLNGVGHRVIDALEGDKKIVGLVRSSLITSVSIATLPATDITPFTQADVDAKIATATAVLRDELAQAEAKREAAEVALATAADQERERIALAEAQRVRGL